MSALMVRMTADGLLPRRIGSAVWCAVLATSLAPGLEQSASAGEPKKIPRCAADLDGSGVVNGFDLALLLGAWGRCPDPGDCLTDLDASGFVDGFDLAMLLAAWT